MPTILSRVVAVVTKWSKLPNNDTTEPLQNIWARSPFRFTIPFHPQAVDDLTDRLQTEFRNANPDTRDLSQLTSAAYAPVGSIASTDDLNDEVFRSHALVPVPNVAHIAGFATPEAQDLFVNAVAVAVAKKLKTPTKKQPKAKKSAKKSPTGKNL